MSRRQGNWSACLSLRPVSTMLWPSELVLFSGALFFLQTFSLKCRTPELAWQRSTQSRWPPLAARMPTNHSWWHSREVSRVKCRASANTVGQPAFTGTEESSLPCSDNFSHSWAKDFKDPDLVRVAGLQVTTGSRNFDAFCCFLASALCWRPSRGCRRHLSHSDCIEHATAFVKRLQTVKTSQNPSTRSASFSRGLFWPSGFPNSHPEARRV